MITIIFQCISIIVFLASIIFIIMQFWYESKQIETIYISPVTKPSNDKALYKNIAFYVIALGFLIYIFGFIARMVVLDQYSSFQSNWIRWDAQHYLRLAKEWYTGGGSTNEIFIVFYPLFPLLIKLLSFIIRSDFLASMLLSNFFIVVGCCYMYKLFEFEFDKKTAINGVKYLLLFPVAFFLFAPFTESLYIMLSVMMFYYLRKEKWFLSAILAMLAGMTRFHGILLVIPFIIEFLIMNHVFRNVYERKFRMIFNDFIKKGIYVLIIPIGFISYLTLNKVVTGDWFKFLYWQKQHWAQSFKIFYEGSIPLLVNQLGNSNKLYVAFMWVPEIIAIIIVFSIIIYAIKIKLRASYFAYMAIFVFSTISLATLLSAPRYIMAAFPIYIVIAKVANKNKKIDIVLTTVTILFLAYCLTGYVCDQQIM